MVDINSRVKKNMSKYRKTKTLDRGALQKKLNITTLFFAILLFFGCCNSYWPNSYFFSLVHLFFILFGMFGILLFGSLAIRNYRGRLFPKRNFVTENPIRLPYCVAGYDSFEEKVRKNAHKLGYEYERLLNFRNGDKLIVFTKFDTKTNFDIAYEKVAIFKCKEYQYSKTCTIDQNLNRLKPIENYGEFQQMFYHDVGVELEFRIPSEKIESIIFIVVEEGNYYSECSIIGYHEEDNLVALIDLSNPNLISIGKDIRRNKTRDYNDKYIELLKIIN